MRPHLNERQWRLYLGSEAFDLGRGGVALVARASGAAPNTVRKGLREIENGAEITDRVRAPGGGRPSLEVEQPGITAALEALVEPDARGEPTGPLRWTTRSRKQLREGLRRTGFRASIKAIAALLKGLGYRLQKVKKTKEGADHPDRDAQFGYINDTCAAFLDTGDPVLSIDCKKKELVGEYAQAGREWQPGGNPVEVNGHDFPAGVPKAIPYGIYDIGANEGWVSVGVSAETAAFAVNTLRQWWYATGRDLYGHIDRLCLTADAGGSNSYRSRAWKAELAAFCAETGISVTVLHYPPGTSKWNRVEHRLFSFVSMNWRGRPLTDYQVILDLIGGTETEEGLSVTAWLDEHEYPTGIKITDAEMASLPIEPHEWHGSWNYTIHPA
nr:ISAzo13 family transposase [Glycomyces arizonensis]